MEKISGTSKVTYIIDRQKTNQTDSNLFQKTFEKVLENKQGSEAIKEDMKSAPEISLPIFYNSDNYSPSIIKKADKLLNLLDHYANEIANSKKTLNDIEPLMLSLKNDASLLMEEANETLQDNQDLKKIISQCALTANVEYIKFKRGDYI